jgi:phospholipase/carboxylesterase
VERLSLGPLSCLVKRTTPDAPVLVALHGRGASADDLADLGDAIDPQLNQIYPDAPLRWPAGGPSIGLAWYDSGPDRDAEIAASRAKLRTLLERAGEVAQGPVYLMGFSQGALMSLDTGLREGSPAKLVIALSGYLHQDVGGPQSPPTLVVHGTKDDVVPVEKGRDAHQRLVARGVPVTYEEFPMAHEIRPAVLKRIREFIAGVR